MDDKYRLPLGLIKQASLKLEAFAGDVHEILMDEDLNDYERGIFTQMTELSATMMAHLLNIIREECGEEEFLAEQVPMEEIGEYPGDSGDIMDEPV